MDGELATELTIRIMDMLKMMNHGYRCLRRYTSIPFDSILLHICHRFLLCGWTPLLACLGTAERSRIIFDYMCGNVDWLDRYIIQDVISAHRYSYIGELRFLFWLK